MREPVPFALARISGTHSGETRGKPSRRRVGKPTTTDHGLRLRFVIKYPITKEKDNVSVRLVIGDLSHRN